MSWARIDDAFDDHPKVLAVLEHDQGGAAIGLWTLCLTWAYRNTLKRGKEPGRLPAHLPRRYLGPAARELAALLVKEGLWEARGDGEGWQIHDFEQYLATPKTREARAEAGRKGAAARWGDRPGKTAGRDGNLPSDPSNLPSSDGKPMASDGRPDPEVPADGESAPQSGNLPSGDGNEPSTDGNLPSGLPFGDGKPVASDGSRAPTRRAISKEIASRDPSPVPPSAGSTDEPTAQTILASFIDWDRANGGQLTRRTTGQLAKYIGEMVEQGISDRHIRRGLADWRAAGQNPSTLDSFVSAAMKGSAPSTSARPSTSTQRAQQAINAGEELQRMIDEGRYPA